MPWQPGQAAVAPPSTTMAWPVTKLAAGERVKLTQGGVSVDLELALDDRIADGVIRVATAHPSTSALASMYGAIAVAKA